MRKKIETADLSNEQWKAFAITTPEVGWTEQVMTTTESPNYIIDNPKTYNQAIDEYIRKVTDPFFKAVIDFNMQEAKVLADEKRAEAEAIEKEARIIAEQTANEIIKIETV